MSGLREEVVGGDCLDPCPPLLIKQYPSFIFWFIYLSFFWHRVLELMSGLMEEVMGGDCLDPCPPLLIKQYPSFIFWFIYLSFFLHRGCWS